MFEPSMTALRGYGGLQKSCLVIRGEATHSGAQFLRRQEYPFCVVLTELKERSK
jgi:hypothetical protein